MAPKAADTEPAAPRRSTRISSQPVVDPVQSKPKAPAKAKAPAKRSAEADDDKASKKVPRYPGEQGASDEPEVAAASSATEVEIIDIGDSLPSVTLKNEKGEDIDVSTLTNEKGLIVFLVPKADTPGCTTQACGFRDIYPDFTSVNYEVYCLSADTPTAQTKWQTKKELPYPLLSDPKRILIRALGAGEGGKTKRSHFVFAQGGKLLDKRIPVKAADSPKLALEFVKSL
ncbi:AhpC-TSA-domain-containing protein [Athelia psychrophila]|uniref:thioredoxin-dependent peroxiredoxin n=1 Tax=Athelia psychrophila TaxID=1759441 RepID=A0A166DN17_9AGAM|nr:AhpC-TSA-domain-containing protein [Fibularhizoctonia sp. CBS 109695]